MKNWNVRKAITPAEAIPESERLHRSLSWPHLVALGVGAIVGTGILTLTGVGADRAGPAVLISFCIAGLICAGAALCYAEMSTSIPASGSAYTYSYTVLGEGFAWIVGWSLILEYSLVVSTVAVGWAGYANDALRHIGLALPGALTHGPTLAGQQCGGSVQQASFGINILAVVIIAAVATLLNFGTRESARINTGLVVLKLATLSLFVIVALPYFNAANLHPFAPHGFFSTPGACGRPYGVMPAAAIIFFAFYGFDAISTAAEEAKNPERDLAIGIVGSMVACTLIYLIVAAAAVGAVHYTKFANSPEPLALILREAGQGRVATIVSAGAVIALPTVILAFLYGQSRIFLVMARDGFFPKSFSTIWKSRGTPARITTATAAIVAIIAAVTPIDVIASLANAGTLCAFVAVAVCVLVRRRRDPDANRPFRTPLAWIVAPLTILGCVYLFTNLSRLTITFFLTWNVVGLFVYFVFASRSAHRTRSASGA
ncbi:amino acid permease [Sphingomonas sp. URHD0057]|uniref:amino acid permease n=1 Tax=Sphingomonas sp. URHD0057 TaxID=1380389 RepID=UPI00056CB60A|nr:amino acid permease [Sphingomonas sp. URHD0057]